MTEEARNGAERRLADGATAQGEATPPSAPSSALGPGEAGEAAADSGALTGAQIAPESDAAAVGAIEPGAADVATPETDAPALQSVAQSSLPGTEVAPEQAAVGAAVDGMTSAAAAEPAAALLGQGGPVLLVLALLSVAALSILLVKLWQFARLQINAAEPVGQALRLWYQHEPGQAILALQGSPQPTARLLERALGALATPGVDLTLLREELVRFASAQLESLRAWLRALEVIAALSPLLGLLGTVLGMIQAFRQLELAGNQVDPAVLSGGIWQALLTTAAGLAVAIPVVLLHSWLERRVERCGHQMEDAVTRVFTRNLVDAGQAVSETRPDQLDGTSAPGSVSVASQAAPQHAV